MTIISISLWILGFMIAPTLYGQTLDEVYAKESAINKYSSTIIHYEWVRDRHFGHDSAINRLMAKILDDVALWSQGYQALSDIGPVGDLDRIVTDVARGVRLQATKSESLLHRMDEVMVLLDLSQRLLADNQNTPDHPDFTRQKEAIIRQRQDLDRRINKLKNIILDLRKTVRSVASGFGYDFFSSKLKAVSLAKGLGDAESVLAGYQDFIRAELTAGPWLGRLEHESQRAIGHMIALEFHSARASLETLKASYQNLLHELESSGLHPTEAARIRAELESYVHEATSRYRQTIEPYPDAILGQSMQRLKLRKFRHHCQDAQPSASQRCDLLAWLRDIDPASVKTFDTKKLEDLESKWQLVESSMGGAI